MVSAVPAEDSSSASVKHIRTSGTFSPDGACQKTEVSDTDSPCISVISIKQVSEDVLKLETSSGPAFFVRLSYLVCVGADTVTENAVFADEKAGDIFQAADAYLAERAAAGFLARGEYSFRQLLLKLRKKGFSSETAEKALVFLQNRGLVDDRRFAEAWLRNRIIHHSEGRRRLMSGLVSRGVESAVAESCVDDFLKICSEKELFERAVEKCSRAGRNREQKIRFLLQKGFSYSYICKNFIL